MFLLVHKGILVMLESRDPPVLTHQAHKDHKGLREHRVLRERRARKEAKESKVLRDIKEQSVLKVRKVLKVPKVIKGLKECMLTAIAIVNVSVPNVWLVY
jgi:hypothetical protein